MSEALRYGWFFCVCANFGPRQRKGCDAARSTWKQLLPLWRRDTGPEQARTTQSRDSTLALDWRPGIVGFVSVEDMPVWSIAFLKKFRSFWVADLTVANDSPIFVYNYSRILICLLLRHKTHTCSPSKTSDVILCRHSSGRYDEHHAAEARLLSYLSWQVKIKKENISTFGFFFWLEMTHLTPNRMLGSMIGLNLVNSFGTSLTSLWGYWRYWID